MGRNYGGGVPIHATAVGVLYSGELAGIDKAEDDANSDLLDMDSMEEENDNRAPSPVDSDFYEVCSSSSARLSTPWPTAQDAEGTEWDLYDGKRLLILLAVPACMKEASHFWSNTLRSKLPTKGCSKLEIHGMVR